MSTLRSLHSHVSRCFGASLLVLGVCMMLCVSLTRVAQAQSGEPVWQHNWQQPLVDYLKSLKVEDVKTGPMKVDASWFESHPQNLERYRYLIGGYTPLLPFVQQLASFPAKDFTWSHVWRGDLPIIQDSLNDSRLHVTKGQLWVPAHPSAACLYAWAYHENQSWNPYANSKPMANRAAVTGITALLGWTLDDDYYRDPASNYKGRRWGVHGGITGFTLTFQAYTLLRVKDALPPAVVKAWSDGLVHLCHRIDSNSPTGPANMRLSVPVGMYYTWLATGDPAVKKLYNKWTGQVLFSNLLSPAGHYNDGEGRGPDGSYNGIATHRIAELYSITHDDDILKVLKQFYQLKAYQTLPEPDGSWLSPSHYNDRTQSSFANDQYAGRETQIATVVPYAALFLKRQREKNKPLTPATLASLGSRPSNRLPSAFPYNHGTGRGGRMHDWGNILHLPDFEYHQDEAAIDKTIADSTTTLPVLASNHFTRNFNNEFYSVRRPAYYALFFAGATSTSDNGTTNYRNMLKDHGGLFNGFAGGGMSALWTPAGTFIVGRLTAHENYHRETYTPAKTPYLIEGWQDWANNHLVGQTLENKILGSSRVSWPMSKLSDDQNHLTIASSFPKTSQRQKTITDADIHYQRDYQFNDASIDAKVTLTSDKNVTLKTLYEVIPVHITKDLQTIFLDEQNRPLAEADVIRNVKTIGLQRDGGRLDIVLDRPRDISRASVQITSKQANSVDCRNLLITLPVTFQAGQPQTLSYKLVPKTNVELESSKIGAVTSAADAAVHDVDADQHLELLIQDKTYELLEHEILAHYTAASVEAKADGSVTRWRDLSGNHFDLTPFAPATAPRLSPDKSAVVFDIKQILQCKLPTNLNIDALAGVALVDCDVAFRTTRPLGHARVVSIPTQDGPDYLKGLSLNPYQPGAPEMGKYTLANSRSFRGATGQPVHLATGGRIVTGKDGSLVFTGPFYKGKVYEMLIYRTHVSRWQLGQLSDRMLRLHRQADTKTSEQTSRQPSRQTSH